MMMEDGSLQYLDLIAPDAAFSEEKLAKRIKKFVKSPNSRFDVVEIPENKQGVSAPMMMGGIFGDSTIHRPVTWTDIFYIICNDVLSQKYIMICLENGWLST